MRAVKLLCRRNDTHMIVRMIKVFIRHLSCAGYTAGCYKLFFIVIFFVADGCCGTAVTVVLDICSSDVICVFQWFQFYLSVTF